MNILTEYREELTELTLAAKAEGVELQFFRGLWRPYEVAFFLGISYEAARKRQAGLADVPVIRLGASIRFKPADIISLRERLYTQATQRQQNTRAARLRLAQ